MSGRPHVESLSEVAQVNWDYIVNGSGADRMSWTDFKAVWFVFMQEMTYEQVKLYWSFMDTEKEGDVSYS